MKTKIFILIASIVCMFSCTDGLRNDIDDLKNKYDNLDSRVAKLEEHCKEMNTNISSLQTLVSVILNNDYIVSITPIMKENKEIGYTITFAIHAPITIYHGQNGADGKDGQNGKDGKDGVTPIIGVAQDEEDHAYYWTLNGEWLLDVNGNRIPLTSRDGKDGKDGQDGKPGQNGQDGKDGKDGITPQLKIENGYWYVSTDNGTTWTQLGKAVGEDGQDGKDGKDGQDGDSMFSSVTQDENFVYFTLANGTVLTVSKYKDDSVKIVDGAIMAEFSVSETKRVYFSQGDLMYSPEGTHLCADGTTKTGTWRFAEDQVNFGDAFYWGDSGYRTAVHTSESSYVSFFQSYLSDLTQNISGTNYDWGQYNAIENGGNTPNIYRTLTKEEWNYLLNSRPNSDKLKGTLWIYGSQEYLVGFILPDNWDINIQIPETLYTSPQLYEIYPEWKKLEDKGCIILRYENGYHHYYTSSYGKSIYNAYNNYSYSCYCVDRNNVVESNIRYYGASATSSSKTDRANKKYVRLVKDVE